MPRRSSALEHHGWPIAALAHDSKWHEVTVQVGVRRTSENGVTFPVGKSLRAWGKLTPCRHGDAHLSQRSDCESALGEITISDEAGECGNRLGTVCSAHLRNSWTNTMHIPPKWG